MSPTRAINVVTLSLILFLAGCFGAGSTADAADEHTHTPNASPTISLDQPLFGESNFTCETNSCNGSLFHAVVDADGDVLTSMGWDFNLDGLIDAPVITNRGETNVSIPIHHWTMLDDESGWTSVAFIAVDSNGAASAELISISSDLYLLYPTLPVHLTFSERDAAGDMSADGGDALVHIQMTSGDGLSWAVLKVSIVVDGGASYTCAEGDASADCTYSKDDDKNWETSEEITISEGDDTNMCGQDATGCEVVVTLTKLGVGEEDDKVIATVTAFADTA